MTLDEAIEHCKHKSKDKCSNEVCRDDHRQLSAWLEELKELREKARRMERILTESGFLPSEYE